MDEKRIPTNWYHEFFESELWAQVHVKSKTQEQTLKEVEFVKKVVAKDGALDILDLPCGTGRHSIELAKEGHRVVGVDGSKRLLQIANENSFNLANKPEWILADMRDYRKLKSFDVVMTLWGSLGYFSDVETQKMFTNIRESLKPNGVLIFDQPVLDTFLLRGMSPNHWSEHDGLYIMEKTNWIAETGRNESEWVFVNEGKISSYKSSIRIYSFHELNNMLLAAGFTSIKAFGSVELKPFSVGDRLFCVAGIT